MGLIASPNLHFIPGYTGFFPQYNYRLDDTYATTTHKVVLDPAVHHADSLVLFDRSADDYKVLRPSIRDIDMVNETVGHTIYKHPMVPGYGGFVPGEHAEFGHSYTVQATEALSDFERLQTQDRDDMEQITKIGYLQDDKWDPKTLDNEVTQSEFKLPLLEARPECEELTEPPITRLNNSPSPYFSDYIHPERYLKAGYTGHVPFGYATDRPDPPILMQPVEIYHKYIGLLPHYGGYIPGAMFRYGNTFGNDTIDSKRRLRGDFSN